jgi:hypothetical protein
VLKKTIAEAGERGGLSDEAEAAIRRALGILPPENEKPSGNPA